MPTYTVHAPPLKRGETSSAPERFTFVRDGFHFWAFVFPELWLLLHRLWLSLVGYALVYGVIVAGFTMAGAPRGSVVAVSFIIHLLMGFEAATLQRWTYTRRKWASLGFVVAEDAEEAERRFYVEWTMRSAAPVTSQPPPAAQAYAAPVRRGAPNGDDVFGLFPEPGASR
jgi:hypothetical protein